MGKLNNSNNSAASASVYPVLAAIIIVGFMLSYLLYSGPFYEFDDLSYIAFSHSVLTATFNPASNPYSYSFLFPTTIAISIAMFGANAFAAILPTLLEYAIIIVATFTIARKLYGSGAGLIAAFLAATAPFVAAYSTRVLPDMGLGALVSISMLFFFYARKSDDKNERLYLLLSGAFAILTVYIKLTGIVFVLSFILALLFYRFYDQNKEIKSQKRIDGILIYPIIGIIVLGIIYLFIIYAFSGNVFVLLKYSATQVEISTSGLGENLGALFTTFFGYGTLSSVSELQQFPLGLIIFLALAGTAFGLIRREKNIVFISIILWFLFACIFFGSLSLTRYSPPYVATRYFIMISSPIAIIACYAVLCIGESSRSLLKNNSRYVPAIILLITILSYIPIYAGLYNYNISIAGDTRAFLKMLEYVNSNSNGNEVSIAIVGDNQTAGYLRFLSGYNQTTDFSVFNLSSRPEATKQIDYVCAQNNTDSYVALVYDNYSRLRYTTAFNSWISTECNLVKVGDFYDNASSSSTYNAMDVQVDLYRIG